MSKNSLKVPKKVIVKSISGFGGMLDNWDPLILDNVSIKPIRKGKKGKFRKDWE